MIDSINDPLVDNDLPFSSFNRIFGRNSDIIKLKNGKSFHPVNIFGGTLFRQFPEIKRHKVIWDGKELHFVFETDGEPSRELIEKELGLLLAEYETPCRIEYVSKILPGKSGKYRYIEIIE
jgi:phenylacetate-coenzyme A ligase PaaK-like adenylate-forming protein